MIERFRYTECRMEITTAGSYTKEHTDEFTFDSVRDRGGDGGSGIEYRFRVWLPEPFHRVGVVEFTLDTVDPRAVQLALDRETADIRSFANHRLAELAEDLSDGQRPDR